LQVNEQLRALEVARGYTDIVLLSRVIEFSETPIDQSKLAVGVVNHNVVGLHISVHNTLRVAEVESLEHFKDVVANIKIGEGLVESAEVHITRVHELHDEGGGLGHWVSDDVEEVNNVDSVFEGLQNFDLSPNFGFLN